MNWIDKLLLKIGANPLEWISALMAACLGYFAPVKNVFHLMVGAFILDSFLGIWHSLKIEKKGFSREKFFQSFFGRMLLVTAVLMLMYAGDTELGLGTEKLFYILAYIVISVLLINILKNGGELVDWPVLTGIITFLQKKLANLFDIDLDEIKKMTENENEY